MDALHEPCTRAENPDPCLLKASHCVLGQLDATMDSADALHPACCQASEEDCHESSGKANNTCVSLPIWQLMIADRPGRYLLGSAGGAQLDASREGKVPQPTPTAASSETSFTHFSFAPRLPPFTTLHHATRPGSMRGCVFSHVACLVATQKSPGPISHCSTWPQSLQASVCSMRACK